MRFKLAVLDTLGRYCSRPAGKYPAPTELFLLGKPDMQITEIEVKTTNTSRGEFKNVIWSAPYRTLGLGFPLEEYPNVFQCEALTKKSAKKDYEENRSNLINGISRKEMYDCRRGVMGVFLYKDDPPSEMISVANIPIGLFSEYIRLCYMITRKPPYIPTDPKPADPGPRELR
jgi:hypothetical protein